MSLLLKSVRALQSGMWMRKYAGKVNYLIINMLVFLARTPVFSAARTFSAAAAPTAHDDDDDVVVPELHQSLEWLLTSPPPLHQFDEAPIVVETYGSIDPFHH